MGEIWTFSYTMFIPEILLIEWQQNHGGVCKNKYGFSLFLIRNSSNFAIMNSKYLLQWQSFDYEKIEL